MHNYAKKIMESVKAETDSKGFNGFDDAELCRLEKWVCIADKIAEYDYYYHITDEMEKPENEYGKNYNERGRYYTPPRSDVLDTEHMYYRDVDMGRGRMYYPSSNMRGYDSAAGIGDRYYGQAYNPRYYESRFERARRGYEEAKAENPASDNMEKIKEMFKELKDEMKQLNPKMSEVEKQFSRNELNSMSSLII